MPVLLPRRNVVETYLATGASRRVSSASSGMICSVVSTVLCCAVLLWLLEWAGLGYPMGLDGIGHNISVD